MIFMVANRKIATPDEATHQSRVALVPLDPAFTDNLFPLLDDWEVVRMLSEVPWPVRRDDVAAFLGSKQTTADAFVICADVDAPEGQGRNDSRPIGVCAVKKPGTGNPPRQMPRLGYWIGRLYWGRGFGTEAIAELVDRAFRMHPHDRVGAGVFRDNAASQALLRKLGFEARGLKASDSLSRGTVVETLELQVTRSAWQLARAVRP
jgi:8-oxo-dGTP diphosphatase